ncbi:unnamed protein product [Lactuca saligna]|uniref:Uncharacterized protein n=1 Tax=Lactuca saligna TaxID=75948 RepID=A0AA35VML7_LACSI|nr:unnamed protein product [Lactuca saligna]
MSSATHNPPDLGTVFTCGEAHHLRPRRVKTLRNLQASALPHSEMTIYNYNNHNRTTSNHDDNAASSSNNKQPEQPHYPPYVHTSFQCYGVDGCAGVLIYFTQVLLHLIRLNHQLQNPTATMINYLPPLLLALRETSLCHHRRNLSAMFSATTAETYISAMFVTRESPDPATYMENKPTYRVYTKAKTDFSLTIRGGKMILAASNASDPLQHWIKDDKFGKNIKDEEDFSSFALVNKVTGQAVKYPIGVAYTVQLTKYNPDELDVAVLWSNGCSLGDECKHAS